MDEKEAIDTVVNCLTDHNLRMGQDYRFVSMKRGCFNIKFCPHRHAVVDVAYFYKNIPDIKIFKIQQNGNFMNLIIKIKLRGSC